jgi:pyruvate kinase
MSKNIKLICTVGPSSVNESVLKKFKMRGVYLIRINLSHIEVSEIEHYIRYLKKFDIPIAIDTEGAQIRTGNFGTGGIQFSLNDMVKIYKSDIVCDNHNIYFTPYNVISYLVPGHLISLDFNSVLLRVEDISSLKMKGYIECRVIVGGYVGSKKGVHCDGVNHALPPFSEKDLKAIDVAKEFDIKYFTLSFINSENEVKYFKNLYPDSVAYAKIETIRGVENISSILKCADGILIDRSDLSREIPIEKMPLTQKILIETACACGKEVFVASNIIERMADDLKPSRAEVNDVINTIIDGASGFVLTKETAVGKYPVETVNMMNNLIQQGEIALSHSVKQGDFMSRSLNISALKDRNYITHENDRKFLTEPHGGRLVNCLTDPLPDYELEKMPTLAVNQDVLMDLEQIAIGTFSPLDGFLCEDDYQSVLNRMQLSNGVAWTIPIVLPVTAKEKGNFNVGEPVAIISEINRRTYGVLELQEIYPFDKEEFAIKVYNTNNAKHPGIKKLRKMGDFLLGGKIKVFQRNDSHFSNCSLTPRQIRSIFEALGWSKVVGFHTRNVIHRSHEYIQLESLDRSGCDGLFVHPVAGDKKKGDYTTETIIQSYDIMLEKYYPKNRVVFGVLSTYSRYAGPREAIFTALCRKNYGCSHFIVGRDHTGVGDFYHPTASQTIFEQFDNLGIEPIFFGEIGYSKSLKRYVDGRESTDGDLLKISGTEARNMFIKKYVPPDWFMRPDIAQLIINKLKNNEKVFL